MISGELIVQVVQGSVPFQVPSIHLCPVQGCTYR